MAGFISMRTVWHPHMEPQGMITFTKLGQFLIQYAVKVKHYVYNPGENISVEEAMVKFK